VTLQSNITAALKSGLGKSLSELTYLAYARGGTGDAWKECATDAAPSENLGIANPPRER